LSSPNHYFLQQEGWHRHTSIASQCIVSMVLADHSGALPLRRHRTIGEVFFA
jgi:hypothetical protein